MKMHGGVLVVRWLKTVCTEDTQDKAGFEMVSSELKASGNKSE